MVIRVSSKDKEKLLKSIEAIIMKQNEEFWSQKIADKHFITEDMKYSPQVSRIRVYTNAVIKALEKDKKIKFLREEQGRGPVPRKIYGVVQ